MSDADALLGAFEAQLRVHVPDQLPDFVRIEWDGPVIRTVGLGNSGWVEYADVSGLASDELDELIARQIEVFAARSEPFEWKLYGHDRPADLPDRLRAAGFAPEDTETVVIARVETLAVEPALPDGVVIREVTDRSGFSRIAELEQAVWNEDSGWVGALADEWEFGPERLRVFVAVAGKTTVSAGWVRFPSGTEFATFWGGATLPAWRGRGIYRALVAHRAQLAAERGCRYIEVDASDDSRPILERLGFVPVTTTTPFIWSPPADG